MPNYQKTIKKFLWIVLAAAILMGCGAKGKPAEFKQTPGEMKEGPGLFTGEDGALVVYDSERGGALPQFRGDKSEEGSKDTAEATGKVESTTSDKPVESTQMADSQTSKESNVSPEEAKAFQEFQEWKQEQAEFRKFQEWKNTSKGAAEYKEFLEWKEWKSYQEWKKQQGQ